jgi:hypothetical protein
VQVCTSAILHPALLVISHVAVGVCTSIRDHFNARLQFAITSIHNHFNERLQYTTTSMSDFNTRPLQCDHFNATTPMRPLQYTTTSNAPHLLKAWPEHRHTASVIKVPAACFDQPVGLHQSASGESICNYAYAYVTRKYFHLINSAVLQLHLLNLNNVYQNQTCCWREHKTSSLLRSNRTHLRAVAR